MSVTVNPLTAFLVSFAITVVSYQIGYRRGRSSVQRWLRMIASPTARREEKSDRAGTLCPRTRQP